ncbi:MAG: PilZ domain-containing protein [Treponema sp.]|jgi:c-di-GMP-binding flagellar brake protein YcgR|nr:PilZ domain-containing protein [Treponema sp.]
MSYIFIALIISAVIIAGLVKLYLLFREKINFFLRGLDESFHFSELNTLWNVSQICNLEEPISLFYSMPSLAKCISHIKTQAEAAGALNSAKFQKLLTKLYEFRNKIEKNEDKKRGLESTQSLSNHQKLRIILPGKGVFSSEIVNNGRELTIKLPTQKNQITVDGKNWVGQTVNVYLWRTGDARYVFDTTVTHEGLFLGKPSLFLKHTTNLIRTQKRNAIRSKCHISAELYILKEKVIDYNIIETKPGYKCLLEDISENGALIRIGGKGLPNIQIRLQFQVNNRLVVMFGIVRTVEYNEELNQSRLHFECIHIEPAMKNQILSYVYNIMSDSEKEIYDALKLTDTDEKTESETAQNSSGLLENTAEKAEAISEKIADTDDVLKNAKNLVDSDSNAKETELTKNTENDELDLDEE